MVNGVKRVINNKSTQSQPSSRYSWAVFTVSPAEWLARPEWFINCTCRAVDNPSKVFQLWRSTPWALHYGLIQLRCMPLIQQQVHRLFHFGGLMTCSIFLICFNFSWAFFCSCWFLNNAASPILMTWTSEKSASALVFLPPHHPVLVPVLFVFWWFSSPSCNSQWIRSNIQRIFSLWSAVIDFLMHWQ